MGEQKTLEKECELREKMNKLELIKRRTEAKMREQKDREGAALKRRNYATLPEDWGAPQLEVELEPVVEVMPPPLQ